MTALARHVGCRLVLDVIEPVRMTLQVAPSTYTTIDLDESFQVTSDGSPVKVVEIGTANGRVHVCSLNAGRVEIDYAAAVSGPPTAGAVSEEDRLVYLRPSRYAESDRLAPIAQAEFAGITDAAELLAAVSSWVGSRLSYVPGSSGPTEGAVDTMLKREGVCRDYAHLVVAFLRALDVPARMVAVYAPGLQPMDFHAVAEAVVENTWRVVDATLLAPRTSLVRIATGRDAADTAFLSTYGGAAQLLETEIIATVEGSLPQDNVHDLVTI